MSSRSWRQAFALDTTLDEARDALDDLQHWANDRETWRNVGMALKHEFGDDAWELFDEWSKKGRGYKKRENRGGSYLGA